MPFHLPTTSRRTFLAHLGGAAVLGPASGASSGDRIDPHRVAILNDTHIGTQHPEDAPAIANLRETVTWLVALERLPAAVIINGDLSLSRGNRGDYERFARLIAPLREAGIPVHLTLGNHDDRNAFYKVFGPQLSTDTPVESKHVGLVQLHSSNLFLLDSLKKPLVTPGLLGTEQLSWLGQVLDAHADKPALIFSHHNPRFGGEEKYYPGGLEDSAAFWDLLVSRPHVKAYVHGHLHHRGHSQHRGIHILNTPATSFVLRPGDSTTGWTMAQLADDGGVFTTLTHEKTHAWNRAVIKLAWQPG